MSTSDMTRRPTRPDSDMAASGQKRVLGASRPLIAGLTGIRALAAAWVVLDHFQAPMFDLLPASRVLKPYVEDGYLGVEVFFVLSGFIIAYNYSERFAGFRKGQYLDFVVLRIARIYPVHLFTLLFLGLLFVVASTLHFTINATYTAPNFVANVILLQAVPPFFALNGPAWSICAEFAAYLAFPLLALSLRSIRTAAKGFLLSGVVAVAGTGLILIVSTWDSMPTSYPLIWLRIITEFATGCLMYSGWRHLGDRRQGSVWGWAALGALLGVAVLIAVVGAMSASALVTIPLIAAFVLSCAGATGVVAKVLCSRILQWGGKVSYSVYMTHFIVLSLVSKFLPSSKFNAGSPQSVAVLVACFVTVIVVGATCYYLIEKPGRHLISQYWARRRGERVANPVEAS